MEQTLKEVLARDYNLADKTLPESLQKDLEAYKHVVLTDEELAVAVLDALKRKEIAIEQKELEDLAAENRRKYTQSKWTIDQTRSWILHRMSKLQKAFIVDETNEPYMELLAAYFSSDPVFVGLAASLGVTNASLDKGLLLAGAVGVGKTAMMTLYSKNQRQVYEVRTAQDIAENYLNAEYPSVYVAQMTELRELPLNDLKNLYQTKAGLCIDDVGSEVLKTNYGNKKNVIAEIVESRYAAGTCGAFLHMTTNLTSQQLKEAYGERVSSRLREKMNVIVLKGKDRRK